MSNHSGTPQLTDGFNLAVDALRSNGIETIYGIVGIPITDLARIAQASGIRDDVALLPDILDVLSGSALPAPAPRRPELREELSTSELRVLRFLPSNLSAPEIGRELYLSLSTIKTHMRHIYAKLGVHRRTEAVERARELGLLAPSARLR